MADDQQVEIELKAKDSASRVVQNISRATGKLLKSVDKITKGFGGIMSRYGGIGAALSLGASVNSAKKYFDQIQRIKREAGGTANEIASVKYMMGKAGVASGTMEATWVRLAKLGGQHKANVGDTRKMVRQLGITTKDGPLRSMIELADRVKEGKVGYKELEKLGGQNARKLQSFLSQGGAAIQKQYDEASKKMGHVNDKTMMQYSEFKRGVGKISQAWNRMVVIVGAKLLPILTKLMDGISGRIDKWAEGAAKFGDFLVKHMDTVVTLAKVFGKVMMANYVLMKLTGKGLSGHMTGMVAGARKRGAGAAALTVANQVGLPGFRGRAATGIGAMMGRGGKVGKLGGVLMRFFNGIALLSPIIKLLLKLTVVGVVVAAVVAGIKMALKTSSDIGKKITKLFKGIWKDIKNIGSGLAEAFGEGSVLGDFIKWIGSGLLKVFTLVLGVVKAITGFVATAIYMVNNKVGWDKAKLEMAQKEFIKVYGPRQDAMLKIEELTTRIVKNQGRVTKSNIDAFREMRKAFMSRTGETSSSFQRYVEYKNLQKLQKAAGKTDVPGERPNFIQDFRGSHFDITQKFAEGFDPDRIAIAFANDLSNFGDQQVQSNMISAFTGK